MVAADQAPAGVASVSLGELLGMAGSASPGLILDGRTAIPHNRPGPHRSPGFGRGLEYRESRPYQQGDDWRHIDWRQTARRGRPFTRLYAAERERSTWILLDRSPSMRFGTRTRFKIVQAARAAAWVTWSSVLGGDRVGTVVGGRIMRPRNRPAGALAVLGAWVESEKQATNAVPGADTLLDDVRSLRSIVRPGDLLVVVTDGYGKAGLAAHLAPLAAQAHLALVLVHDPLERRAPENGVLPVALAGGPRWFDFAKAEVREEWVRSDCQRQLFWADWCMQRAVPAVSLATNDDVAQTLGLAWGPRRGGFGSLIQ